MFVTPPLGCVRLQEVNAAPVRFIADLLQEDSWSHAFMDTLAPRGFVKVRREQRWCLQMRKIFHNCDNTVVASHRQ